MSAGHLLSQRLKKEDKIRDRDVEKSLHDGFSQETLDETFFHKQHIVPKHEKRSALSEKLASTSNTSSNPFTELYALIGGRTDDTSMLVNVFFPHASRPFGSSLHLKIRKDATVEEVIGFALWSYWEENWLPSLEDGLGSDDSKRAIRMSAVGWVLRIAEEDGEVDEDFPGLIMGCCKF